MSGPTDELGRALVSAITAGMKNFEVQGRPAVWYIQLNYKGSTETIVCIAGRSAWTGHYWKIGDDQRRISQSYRPAFGRRCQAASWDARGQIVSHSRI